MPEYVVCVRECVCVCGGGLVCWCQSRGQYILVAEWQALRRMSLFPGHVWLQQQDGTVRGDNGRAWRRCSACRGVLRCGGGKHAPPTALGATGQPLPFPSGWMCLDLWPQLQNCCWSLRFCPSSPIPPVFPRLQCCVKVVSVKGSIFYFIKCFFFSPVASHVHECWPRREQPTPDWMCHHWPRRDTGSAHCNIIRASLETPLYWRYLTLKKAC